MNKVLTFKVAIEGLEDKIWRKIEITDSKTVADLAYTILATFNSLAYHLYNIRHNNIKYSCMEKPDLDLAKFIKEEIKSAVKTKLQDVDFTKEKEMIMEYDLGSPTTFIITYLESKEIDNEKNYPYIIDGKGRGMLDDLSSYELKDIVEDTDKKGRSVHHYSPGYERDDIYDYRQYNIKIDNDILGETIIKIKTGYEG